MIEITSHKSNNKKRHRKEIINANDNNMLIPETTTTLSDQKQQLQTEQQLAKRTTHVNGEDYLPHPFIPNNINNGNSKSKTEVIQKWLFSRPFCQLKKQIINEVDEKKNRYSSDNNDITEADNDDHTTNNLLIEEVKNYKQKFEFLYNEICKGYQVDSVDFINKVLRLLGKNTSVRDNSNQLEELLVELLLLLQQNLIPPLHEILFQITPRGNGCTYYKESVFMKKNICRAFLHLYSFTQRHKELYDLNTKINQSILTKRDFTIEKDKQQDSKKKDGERESPKVNFWDRLEQEFNMTIPLGYDIKLSDKSYGKIMQYVHDKIKELHLIRKNGDLLKEKVVVHNGIEYGTCSYELYMSIEKFLVIHLSQEKRSGLYHAFFTNPAVQNNVVFTLMFDKRIREFTPTQGIVSFKQHLYDGRIDKFYQHWDPLKPKELMAMTYIDQSLDTRDICVSPMDISKDPYTQKEMPIIKLFRDQFYTDIEIMVACFAIGRMLHPFKYDGRELLLFIKGIAGTGKSTLCDLIDSFFDPSDTAVFGNRSDSTFELWNFLDKKAIIGRDITESANFDKGNLLSLVSGDLMNVARKNLKSVTSVLEANILLASNIYPRSWIDTDNNLNRRMFHIDFPHQPKRDDQFESVLKKSGGHSYRFINSCFLFVNHFLTKSCDLNKIDFWDNIPYRFIKNRFKFLAHQNKIIEYLMDESTISVEYNTAFSFPLEQFRNGFVTWCNHKKYKQPETHLRTEHLESSLRYFKCKINKKLALIEGMQIQSAVTTTS